MEGYFATTQPLRPARSAPSTRSSTSRCSPRPTRATATSSRSRASPTSTATTTSPASTGSCSSSTTTGIIATSGCLGGLVSQLHPRRTTTRPRSRAGRPLPGHLRPRPLLRRAPGPRHRRRRAGVNPQLLRIARELQAPLLATNDSHYTHKRRRRGARRAAVRADRRAAQTTPKRFKFDGDDFYIKSAAEMRDLFARATRTRATTRCSIAERADVEIEFGQPILPSFPVPEGHDENSYLRELTMEGATERYGDPTPRRTCSNASSYELDVIKSMGFSAYFLVVWDLVRYAEVARHPGRARAGERGRFVRRVLPAHRRHRPDQVRPAVRAVPQPGPQADARHRHGLRLALPRRDDPLRRAEATARTTSRRSSPSRRSRPEPRCATRRACSATRTGSATRSPS